MTDEFSACSSRLRFSVLSTQLSAPGWPRSSAGGGFALLHGLAILSLWIATPGHAAAAQPPAGARGGASADVSAGAPATGPASAPAGGEDRLTAETLAGLAFRLIGPAVNSGRISDIAVEPGRPERWWVAVASGGVWRTVNGGSTWAPVFDGAGSYSIGCVAIDPRNPNVVWVGTGENNSQRSVGFGDGVYRTRDGGANWEHLGLRESEHIGMIAIDPRDSDTVWVAAQGPLWNAGGQRGLYKTSDGGVTWRRVLYVSEDTGVNEVCLDPGDPDTVYASAYQRRRHVWTLINGGPEGAIYKSTDGGEHWRKVNKGLPEVELGRIGLAVTPADRERVYAIVEAADDQAGNGGTANRSGFYLSRDRGETWERRSDFVASNPLYYNEIVADPHDAEHVYALDTFLHETRDGGKTFRRVAREDRHVDDHALWIDPRRPEHLLVGSDGGVYESWEAGANWRFMANLPITQFYRVTADTSRPFYLVYGGTQDNQTLGAPVWTTDRMGIANEHWFVTVGGDGFKTQVDPEDPHVIYSQWQYGGLVRYDRRTGETVDIKPRERPGEAALRWNWDTPLIISPHDPRRLYCAAQRVFRSDDRGESWTPISGDLTRQLDRNALEVMGRIQRPDAVAKHASTSPYGNIVALSESPRVAGLLYAGTDDGLIQVTEDDGATWRAIEHFPGVPGRTYVSALRASLHNPDAVYAAFDNHKQGDYAPHLLMSTDRGRTWTSLADGLPKRNFVLSLAEDHVQPGLLVAGTEFGVFARLDEGTRWVPLKGGLPTIPVRDIDIQRRENDLVLATFGRGIYVLDDYTPLRHLTRTALDQPALLLPVRTALRYVPSSRLDNPNGRGWQGSAFYTAPNPPYGATFTYYLRDKLLTRKEQRQESEQKAEKEDRSWSYPTLEQFRAEDEQQEPQIVLTVRDEDGRVVRRVIGPRDKGLHRVAWDLRYPSAVPPELAPPADPSPWDEPPKGPLAPPGTYSVTLASEIDGVLSALAPEQTFEVVPLGTATTFPERDPVEAQAFRREVARLQRAVIGALRAAEEARVRVANLRKALLATPAADPALLVELTALDGRLAGVLLRLRGDPTAARRNEPQPPSILERTEGIIGSQWAATSPPTGTQRDAYGFAADEFGRALDEVRRLVESDLRAIEERAEAAGAPWTPGRLPRWERN